MLFTEVVVGSEVVVGLSTANGNPQVFTFIGCIYIDMICLSHKFAVWIVATQYL